MKYKKRLLGYQHERRVRVCFRKDYGRRESMHQQCMQRVRAHNRTAVISDNQGVQPLPEGATWQQKRQLAGRGGAERMASSA